MLALTCVCLLIPVLLTANPIANPNGGIEKSVYISGSAEGVRVRLIFQFLGATLSILKSSDVV